ncbi:haloacid dehalogenase-like hydrolase [Streptomyces antimycoticus]|uniref:HAD family hydrolase n=1 Tax=Streptomyces antimycoticus TaxID=68175 RepID=UPI003437AE35
MQFDQCARLILWDIDHTLLDGGGVSRDAYSSAFARVTGRPMSRMADMTGKTDLLIASETLRLHDIDPDPGTLTTFITAVAEELEARADLLAVRGHVLPGVPEALDTLSRVPGVRQSVLTGNMRILAELKLGVFGLGEHLDLDAGAYGDDAEERVALLPCAWKRAQLHYRRDFSATETVIVGDTLMDIATAKAGDARVVAVATGSVSADELHRGGADIVLPDLADTQAVLDAVLGANAGEASGSLTKLSE